MTTKVKQMFESGNFFYGGFALVSVRQNCMPETNVFLGRCGYVLHIFVAFRFACEMLQKLHFLQISQYEEEVSDS